MIAPPPDDAARVVVRAPNWLGDAVLALPAMAAVRRHFGGARLAVAAAPAVAALFREDTDVRPDQVIELPPSTPAAAARLEGDAFGIGILFPNSFRSAWQFRRARIPARWGYATSGRGWLLTRRSRRARRAGHVHQADYYRDLVRGLGIACEDGDAPRLAPGPASRERGRALLAERRVDPSARLIGIAPGAAYGQAKQWPPDRMAALAARLVTDLSAVPVLVGAAHDRDAARAIESWLRAHAPAAAGRVVDLTGQTSLGSLMAVVAETAAFVSNDSGAMHVAAAIGRPVVAIFGPTDERRTRPVGDHAIVTEPVFCRPCMLRDCPIDHRCMTRISVARVYDAVAAAVERAR